MLTINNIIDSLFKLFPSFRDEQNYEPDDLLPYNIIGDLTLDFNRKFLSNKLTPNEIEVFFNFINQMANSEDDEVVNIFIVETLELFSDNQKTVELARQKLNTNGKRFLEKTLKGWNQ